MTMSNNGEHKVLPCLPQISYGFDGCQIVLLWLKTTNRNNSLYILVSTLYRLADIREAVGNHNGLLLTEPQILKVFCSRLTIIYSIICKEVVRNPFQYGLRRSQSRVSNAIEYSLHACKFLHHCTCHITCCQIVECNFYLLLLQQLIILLPLAEALSRKIMNLYMRILQKLLHYHREVLLPP